MDTVRRLKDEKLSPGVKYVSERYVPLVVLPVFASVVIFVFMLVFGQPAIGLIALVVGYYLTRFVLPFAAISQAEHDKERQAQDVRQSPRETMSDEQRLEARRARLAGDLDKLRFQLKREKS